MSLVYTAGAGFNVNGSSAQPLAGFTQYIGTLRLQTGTGAASNADYLPPSTYPTNGGNVSLRIGGNITGAMNGTTLATNNNGDNYDLENLPYDMTAFGSQAKLENWITVSGFTPVSQTIGAFNDIYATDAWMKSIVTPGSTFYTTNYGTSRGQTLTNTPPVTPGDYQLAWYTWFPYLENTIGSFGGGNISVKAGGSIANVQFVAPTNARDAGPYLVGKSYGYDPSVLWNPTDVALSNAAPLFGGYTGLYVQGGGNVSVAAAGDISNVYTYVQNGTTTLVSGGSVSQVSLATASGNISVQAHGTISIGDNTVQPDIHETGFTFTVSGISLIQNANILTDLEPYNFSTLHKNVEQALGDTILTEILTSPATGSVTLSALGSVTLNVSNADINISAWNTNQGILPAQVRLILLAGDVVNNASFVTYPDPSGTVDLLAAGSVELNAGFVVSDANLGIMPTLQKMAGALASYRTVVTSSNFSAATLAPNYDRLFQHVNGVEQPLFLGGPSYLEGQDTGVTTIYDTVGSNDLSTLHPTVLEGDIPAQLIRDFANAVTYYGVSSTYDSLMDVSSVIELQRHAGLHAGDSDPARIIALNGDVTQGDTTQSNNFLSPYENITKPTEVFAGRDVVDLSLLGQNNNASNITSVVAGRDVIWPLIPVVQGSANSWQIAFGVEVAGPGNLLVESGRNVDLGNSAGIQTIGNFLNPTLPSTGASITIETGLGSALTSPNYAAFMTQFVNPATAAANPYAEPLQLFDTNGNLIAGANAPQTYLQGLSPAAQSFLLNRIFFDLVRDSGREHTGAASNPGYELPGVAAIDTTGALNLAFASYQRAYAAIGTFLGGMSASPYGHGDFLGGTSTVRTLSGGNITIMSPQGQIEVGLVVPPSGFPGYSNPADFDLCAELRRCYRERRRCRSLRQRQHFQTSRASSRLRAAT